MQLTQLHVTITAMENLFTLDPVIARLIKREIQRQQQVINLIASENYAPRAICEASGSLLTNKYAEGTPGKRYYSGCEIIDEIEQLAIERCKRLFGAEHANVQPHAGSSANMAAYFALLKPGETILGLNLGAGGHLTHGYSASFSGQFYKAINYTVNRDTEQIDYEALLHQAEEVQPRLIVAGASAYARQLDFEKFAHIAQSVGALFIADIAHIAGLVAAGVHPSPIGFADCVTSTTQKTLRGPRGGFILCKKNYASAVDKAVMPGIQGGPLMQQIAAKAICFELARQDDFKEYQQTVLSNAKALAQELIAYGFRIVTGGTDTHLFVVDLQPKKITGLEAEQRLASAGILATRSCLPFDTQKPSIGSGIRFGLPAITTRGMKRPEMQVLGSLINELLSPGGDHKIAMVREVVTKLVEQFPIPPAFITKDW